MKESLNAPISDYNELTTLCVAPEGERIVLHVHRGYPQAGELFWSLMSQININDSVNRFGVEDTAEILRDNYLWKFLEDEEFPNDAVRISVLFPRLGE
jgi:hypothetical protein